MGNRAGESGAGGRRRRPGKEARMKEEIDRRRLESGESFRWQRRLGEEEESQEEIAGMVRRILSRRGSHQKWSTWHQKKDIFKISFLVSSILTIAVC